MSPSHRAVSYQVWSPVHRRRGAAGRCPAVWLAPASRGAKKGKPQPPAPLRRRCVWSPRCQGASVPAGQGASMVWDSATRHLRGRWLHLRLWLWTVAGPLGTSQPGGAHWVITCPGEGVWAPVVPPAWSQPCWDQEGHGCWAGGAGACGRTGAGLSPALAPRCACSLALSWWPCGDS